MHQPHHRSLMAAAYSTLLALAALFCTTTAYAQPYPPSCGPGADLTIKNGTNCNLNLCLKGFDDVFCWDVPAGDGLVTPWPAGFAPVGVINTDNNTTYDFLTPSPDPNAAWWVPNITISGCCVDVFFDPVNCVIWVVPTSSLPPCQ